MLLSTGGMDDSGTGVYCKLFDCLSSTLACERDAVRRQYALPLRAACCRVHNTDSASYSQPLQDGVLRQPA